MTEFRCPIDGAPLRSATHQINADSTFVHIDGTTHGGFLDLVEKADASRATVQDAVRDWMAHADPANAGLIMSRDQVVDEWYLAGPRDPKERPA